MEEEIRWKVLKAMLDDFPKLRQLARTYLQILEEADKEVYFLERLRFNRLVKKK
jgi:hypothetical protein